MDILGTQYYRPPFPDRRHWADDVARIADAGLNTVQLWVMWGWVERSPGEFVFDDYDELVALAERNGLGVVLSTIAEMQPHWIHRAVPGSEMMDSFGRTVVSSIRGDCNVGLTPGACFDHPAIWPAMASFLTRVVERYRSAPGLRGWDAWNELRWSENADGIVCYCPHTLKAFREWLDRECGGLDGLNRRWHRRYASWDDVWPGKLPRSPYTEMMEFQRFITWRSNRHGRARADLIRSLDPAHPVTAHGGRPCVLHSGGYPDGDAETPAGTSLNRGNDWEYAQCFDAIGCSSFPVAQGFDEASVASRIDFIRAPAAGKPVWLSEMQGGAWGPAFGPGEPVRAAEQQRWVWTAVSRAVQAFLFWTWRDEVFGEESGWLGISGSDGFAGERLEALQTTARLLLKHEELLRSYRPDEPEVGLWFSPRTYYLHWVQEAKGETPRRALQGYARALVRTNVPFTLVEEDHLEALDRLRILFLPRTIVVDDTAADFLSAFVRRGGTLVVESECGAFDGRGFYRYPAERFLARLAGIEEVGRRRLPPSGTIGIRLNRRDMRAPAAQWLTPFRDSPGEVLALSPEGPLALRVQAGSGSVVAVGTYLGDAYLRLSTAPLPRDRRCLDFERFVRSLAEQAGIVAPVSVLTPVTSPDRLVHVATGSSNGRRVAFCFLENVERARLRFPPGFFTGTIREITRGAEVPVRRSRNSQECRVEAGPWGVAVLASER